MDETKAESMTRRMLDRLLAVRWDDERDVWLQKSRGMLMLEYLRRAACWAKEVDATGQWPFFDIATHIDPAIRADPELVNELEAALDAKVWFPPVRRTCLAALHWEALVATPGVLLPNLPDPFEPLLLMYERGGGFIIQNGFIELPVTGVPRRTWQHHLKPDQIVELDPATLDALDRG
jgi:hypothetical protein